MTVTATSPRCCAAGPTSHAAVPPPVRGRVSGPPTHLQGRRLTHVQREALRGQLQGQPLGADQACHRLVQHRRRRPLEAQGVGNVLVEVPREVVEERFIARDATEASSSRSRRTAGPFK